MHIEISHLIGNLVELACYGIWFESLYGSRKWLFITITAGFAAQVAGLAFSSNTSIGASGIGFGYMGAALAAEYNMPKKKRIVVSSVTYVWGLSTVICGYILTGIDNAAHIGGFIFGYLIAKAITIDNEPFRKKESVTALVLCLISFFILILRIYATYIWLI